MSSPELTPEAKRRLGLAAGLALAVYAAFLLWSIATHPRGQWDFLTYGLAVAERLDGGDPYGRIGDWSLPFVYPPWTLYLLGPLTMLPPLGWLGLKVLLAGGLLALWRKLELPLLLLALVALVGLHAPLYRDLLSGNVNLLEVSLIWAGLYALYRGREPLFVGFILAASLWKLTPVLFLGLLLFSEHRRRWALMLGGAGLLAGLVGLSFALWPGATGAWLDNVGRLEEFAPYDLSTRALTAELREALSVTLRTKLAPSVGTTLYALAALVFGGFSLKVMKDLDLRHRLLLATVGYALVLPRLKDYALLLLVPAAVFALQRVGKRGALALLLGLLLVNTDSSALTSLPGLRELQMLSLNYLGWLAVFATWCVLALGPRERDPEASG